MVKIYWYSGTGNSLLIAEKIGLRYKKEGYEVKLIKIMTPLEVIEESEEDDIIGVVTPIYAFRTPPLVQRFVQEKALIGRYRFLITTCGGSPGDAHHHIKKTGYDFHYVHNINMPDNCIILPYTPNSCEGESITTPIIQEGISSLDQVIESLLKRETADSTSALTGKLATRLIGWGFQMKPQRFCNQFTVDPSCDQCGVCVKICPEKNISLTEHTVSFADNCSVCLSCMQWCPKSAIQYKKATRDKARYHNPLINYNEMISPVITLKD